MKIDIKNGECTFSPCRKYRYTLWRHWEGGDGYAMFIGLNPSTADEVQDDPTVRRCINFAKDWGYSALCMTNIFAFRATDPGDMKAVEDPVGTDNDLSLLYIADHASVVVAAWGVHGVHSNRENEVKRLLGNKLMCLKLTKDGHPAHPLYLPKTLTPIPFEIFDKQVLGREFLSK